MSGASEASEETDASSAASTFPADGAFAGPSSASDAAASHPQAEDAETNACGRPGPAGADEDEKNEKEENAVSAEGNELLPETPSRAAETDVTAGGGVAAETGLEAELEAELETSSRETRGLSSRASPLPPVDETTPSEGRGDSDVASGASSAGQLPRPSRPASGRPRRRRVEDSPEVARLKQKLDVAAAFLLFAIAAILARRFLARVASGDEF